LCQQAKVKLERVRRFMPFEMHVVDIHRDPLLRRRYGAAIPVVAVDGQDALTSKVTELGLIRALVGFPPASSRTQAGDAANGGSRQVSG
jgi:hypothetical protein